MSTKHCGVKRGSDATQRAARIIEDFFSAIQRRVIEPIHNFYAIAQTIPMSPRALLQAIFLRSEFDDDQKRTDID